MCKKDENTNDMKIFCCFSNDEETVEQAISNAFKDFVELKLNNKNKK